MRKQRNNIAGLEYDQRQTVSRLLFDGLGYGAIRTRMTAAGVTVQLHNSTLLAWSHSPEYKEYCEVRKGFDGRANRNRLLAQVQNDGRGPQSEGDIAEYELLQQIGGLSGSVEDAGQAAALANALANLKRCQHAKAKANFQADLQRLKDENAAAIAAKDAQIAALQKELAELKAGGTADAAAVADQLNAHLGVKL
jgi:uncharacterized protein YjaZ